MLIHYSVQMDVESYMRIPLQLLPGCYKGVYHKSKMARIDGEKDSFHTSQRVYGYTQMPFGLKGYAGHPSSDWALVQLLRNGEADPGVVLPTKDCADISQSHPIVITHRSERIDTGGFSHRKTRNRCCTPPERSKTPRTMDLIHGWIVIAVDEFGRRPHPYNRKEWNSLTHCALNFTARITKHPPLAVNRLINVGKLLGAWK
ncbi:hypothetical protein Tco_0209565 [Tanacetum coccineum]